MRKVFTIWITLCLTVVALACGSNDPEVDEVTKNIEQTDDNGTSTGKRSLVIFFSRAGENWQVGNVERGNTAIFVDYIKELANVDVFEIEPETPYPSDYMECVRYVNDVEIPQNLRPTYKGDIDNLTEYDNIFVGGPIWCGQPPFIFRTFFEKHAGELNGKTVIPFGTHGGSGIGSYRTLIKEYYSNAVILESLGIAGVDIRNASSKTMVAEWLKRIGLDKESTNNDNNNMEQARQEIEQFLRDWSAAMIDADTMALSRLMADNIILRHITGQTQTKHEWLEEVANGSMDYHEIVNRDVSITFIDNQTADLSFTSVITATIWGSRGTWTPHSTMRLSHRNGNWMRVNQDETNAVRSIRSIKSSDSNVFTLSGLRATGKKGIVISNKKKYISK